MPNDAADRPDRADLYRMADDGCPNSTGDTHLHDLAQLWATHEQAKAPEAGRRVAAPSAGSRKASNARRG